MVVRSGSNGANKKFRKKNYREPHLPQTQMDDIANLVDGACSTSGTMYSLSKKAGGEWSVLVHDPRRSLNFEYPNIHRINNPELQVQIVPSESSISVSSKAPMDRRQQLRKWLLTVRHPLYAGIQEELPFGYKDTVEGFRIDPHSFDPSIAIGDENDPSLFKNSLNVFFECDDYDCFMANDDSETTLYLFSFMDMRDTNELLRLLGMPPQLPKYTFDCLSGIIREIKMSRRVYHRRLCYYCEREDCYDECSQI